MGSSGGELVTLTLYTLNFLPVTICRKKGKICENKKEKT